MALEAARRDGTKVEPNPSYGPKHLSREGQRAPTKAVKSYTENSLENKKKYLKTAKSSETSLKKKGEKAKGPKNPTKKGQKKPQKQTAQVKQANPKTTERSPALKAPFRAPQRAKRPANS